MNNFIKKTSSKVLLYIVAALGVFSCDENSDDSEFILDVPVKIESFSIEGSEAEIDQEKGEINISLPYGSQINSISVDAVLPEGATITPDLDAPVNFNNTTEFMVINGNLYKNYEVHIEVKEPILAYSVNNIEGAINHNNNSINITLEENTDLTNITPEIELSEGVTISPDAGTAVDFSEPVVYTVSANGVSEEYTVTVSLPNTGLKIGFLGLADSRNDISDPDEDAAANWVFENFDNVEYLSFEDISSGRDLDHSVIWWHYDEAIELPGIAFEEDVLENLKSYQTEGGSLLLTTFATQYVEALEIVPEGEGPNNVFGDFLPNGFVDQDNSWGISFRTREDHPIFEGLETFDEGKAYLLENETFRLNHTAWWFLPEWGSYENAQGWRERTGGVNLASEQWDDNLDGRVAIAEFPNASEGNTIVIASGAYDWHNEEDPDGNESEANAYISNIRILTENALLYLSEED